MDNRHLVINLIGGPGCGKSTTMAGVFYWLKKHMVNCEMATEYAKDKVWEEDYRAMDDQLYIIGKQFHRISRLIDKVDIVIMDTSLLSSIIYDKNHSDALKQLCIEAFEKFNNMVFFIERDDISYETSGRRENSDKALEIDKAYKELMEELHISYKCLHNENSVETIIEELRNQGYINENDEYAEKAKNQLGFKAIIYNLQEVKYSMKIGTTFHHESGIESEFVGWSKIDGEAVFKITNKDSKDAFNKFINSDYVKGMSSYLNPASPEVNLIIGQPKLVKLK